MSARGRPRVTLKLATSLDGRIATASGESQWITGPRAREAVHRLRAEHDAVLIGSQTAVDDDPLLSVRTSGYDGPQPARIIADARLRTPLDSQLVATASQHGAVTAIITAVADDDRRRAFTERGVTVVTAEAAPGGGVTLDGIFDACETLGVSTLFLEGGGRLAASFLAAGAVDRIEWFRAPIALGGEGRPAIAGLGLDRLVDAPRFRRLDVRPIGDDIWETYAATMESAA